MKTKARRMRSHHQVRAASARTPIRARRPKLLYKSFRACCWLALAFGIASAVYLTWRRSSNLRTVWWIPHSIAVWADDHGRTRNLFAYALLALPVMLLYRDLRKQLAWMAALGALGTLLEYGQLLIPTRWFEWQDIALSLAGLLLSWAIVEASVVVFRRIRDVVRGRQTEPR